MTKAAVHREQVDRVRCHPYLEPMIVGSPTSTAQGLHRFARWLARLLPAVVAAVALVVVAPAPSGWAAGTADEVHYTFTGSTSVAIDWRGTANDVRWGTSTAYGQTATGVAPGWTPWSSAGPFWQLELGGLAPGATYHYSIGGGPDYTFHAPPTSSSVAHSPNLE